VYHGRKLDSVDQLKKAIVLNSEHCHIASLITVSLNGDVVCSVSWIRMADTLDTRFTSNCLYSKIVVADVSFNTIFSEVHAARLSLHQPASDGGVL